MAGSRGSMVWKATSVVLALVAIGATVCAYQRYADAQALRHQLAAAVDDAKQAHSEAAALKARLDATQQHVSEDEQKLASAQQQATADAARLQAESRPDLPVRLSFRHALLSQGEVAVMQNLSSRTLEVTLDVQSSSTGVHFRRVFVINPKQSGQFGPQEGWPFASGQLVTLSNPAFRPITTVVGG